MYRKVSEVVKVLSDRGFCEPHVVEKKGMGGGMQSYVEWHEVVRMLDEAFGPFGWDAVPTTSFTDIANGVFIYDGYVAGRAVDDETGQVLELKRAGRGMGFVPESARGGGAEFDRQGHGAKSDFYSNATKALGEGFGLYLYGSKVRGSSPAVTNNQSRTAAPAPKATGDLGPRPTAGQLKFGASLGWSEDDFNAMAFKEWKAILDEKKRKPAANKVAPVKSQDALVEELFG